MRKFSVKTIIVSVIAVAVFLLLGRLLSVPSLYVLYGIFAFAAAVFGPIAGLLIGLAGRFLSFLHIGSGGFGIAWGQVIAAGIFGLLTGIACRRFTLYDGQLSKRDLAGFNIAQILCCILSLVLVEPLLGWIMEKKPYITLLTLSLKPAAFCILGTAVTGTVLLFIYAFATPRKRRKSEKD